MFSVVILTLNEERNLPLCLESLRGCDDIVVLDSGSSDRTGEIALRAGVHFVKHPFQNFAAQRNYAHTDITFKHRWLFHLDADERMTPELREECNQRAAEDNPNIDGFFVAPRMMFHGRWIRHCTDFPAYQARFVYTKRFRFIQVGHGQRESKDMQMGTLSANYLHDLSADGDEALLEKHRRYAREEAAAFLSGRKDPHAPAPSLFSGNALERRRALKALSHWLPARGAVRFFYQYVLQRGYRDGKPGYAYCKLMARYESWIAQEIRQQRRASSR